METPRQPTDEELAIFRQQRFGQLPPNTMAAGVTQLSVDVPVSRPFDGHVPDSTIGFDGGDSD